MCIKNGEICKNPSAIIGPYFFFIITIFIFTTITIKTAFKIKLFLNVGIKFVKKFLNDTVLKELFYVEVHNFVFFHAQKIDIFTCLVLGTIEIAKVSLNDLL